MAARRPWRVVIGFVAALVVLGGAAGGVGAGFTDEVRLGESDSQRAADVLAERFPTAAGDTATLVFHDDGLQGSDRAREVDSVLAAVADQSDVASVSPLQYSPDGATGFATVLYDEVAADLSQGHLERLEEAVAPLDRAGVEASMRGPVVDRWRDRPVPVGEFVGVLAALVLVTGLFRSVLATVVTVGSALLGLALGNTVLAVVSGFVDIPTVAPTIAIMLGLGAGVDYALFLVARFRARLRAGDDVPTAVRNATSTTGAAVVTAGAIVVVSICGLYVTGITVIGRMGLAAAIVVAVAALAAVTLVPALLRLVGRRVLPRSERGEQHVVVEGADDREGRWARTAAVVVARRPWAAASAATVVLLALAAPTLNLQLGQPDDSNRPAGDTMRVAYDRLADGFGPGFNGPLLVAVDLRDADGSERDGLVERLGLDLAATPGVQQVAPAQVNPAGDTAVVTVIPTTAPQSEETSDLVEELRSTVIPDALGDAVTAHVGGQTATFDDLGTRVGDTLLLLILVVVGLSLVLLTLAFGSLVLPVVSALMNLLSIGAAYGVVTLAFQTEVGTGLLGVSEQPVVSFVPMLMFAILFGLSMDYNVFLLSAVRDERAAGRDARSAVPVAVGRTASLITTAGAIMTLVFLGFAVTDETEVQMIGIGLATAVLIDVTLVRRVLAPALLELLGERAWWLPAGWRGRLGGGLATSH
ncbi:MMPL family transporter [Nocardioides ganghwensis]|uniref:MMPL family transporter n=1 Tax=Nocardioides ganghwensis TaxID=252230 RepID=A0A4Q2SD59_9ACTN|nr:MMPL family transporter [Nocardioides ganghwensis]